MWLFCSYILRYVHQLVTNFVCLPFDIRQVAYSQFIRAFSLNAAARAEFVRCEKKKKVLRLKSWTAELDNNSLEVH